MDKGQLINDIRRFNVSAETKFLAQFDETALKQYLENLRTAQEKRVRVRPDLRGGQKLRLVS